MNKITLVHIFHVLIIGSLFLYVGIYKTKIPELMFPILLGLGIIIILYHIYNDCTLADVNKLDFRYNKRNKKIYKHIPTKIYKHIPKKIYKHIPKKTYKR